MTVQAVNLLHEVEELSQDQCIFIDYPYAVSNQLELLDLQIFSAEKLFHSYIDSTSELANEFNLDKFLNFYADLVHKRDSLSFDTMLAHIGTAVFNYCRDPENKTRCFLDRNIGKLVIDKAVPDGAASSFNQGG